MLTEVSVADWLASKEGQSWSRQHHRPVRYQDCVFAEIKDDGGYDWMWGWEATLTAMRWYPGKPLTCSKRMEEEWRKLGVT
jgi:hypothetical protein